jgi:hypothetical protein
VAENAPQLVASERDATIKAIHAELLQTIKFLQEERIAALEQLTRERIAALKEFHQALFAEREALVRDVEHIGLQTADHALWRAAQLVAATVAVLLLVAVAGLFIVRRMFFNRDPRLGRCGCGSRWQFPGPMPWLPRSQPVDG